MRSGVIAVVVKVTPAAIHQTGNERFSRRPGACHGAAKGAGAVVQIDRFVTVIFNQTLHIAGDGLKGFIPADARELAFTAFAYALHRVFQAVRVVNATAH
ncbi:hypothetical protein D3C75_1030670 [compost metagenome]